MFDICGEFFLVLRHTPLDNISNREVNKTGNARFDILTALLLGIQVFWDVMPCHSVSCSRRCKGKQSKNEDSLPLNTKAT
jgi:hypothetical protein